jgi:hypothetical protein
MCVCVRACVSVCVCVRVCMCVYSIVSLAYLAAQSASGTQSPHRGPGSIKVNGISNLSYLVFHHLSYLLVHQTRGNRVCNVHPLSSLF